MKNPELSWLFTSPPTVFLFAIALRVVLLLYGHFQDKFSALKYTDIDYFVFTDAARYVARGHSPYMRDTYRYTPLLAWILIPTAWGGFWFDFGKVLFAGSDIVAGWLMYAVLRSINNLPQERALRLSCLWLLNPMVAQISTRGSSEGFLAVLVMALLWAILQNRIVLSGVLLGLSVHFKIYPFIYAAAILWWLPNHSQSEQNQPQSRLKGFLDRLINPALIKLAVTSAVTFFGLNVLMLYVYGPEFLGHTYFYHLIRSDHRHNFSPYNLLLYLNSSPAKSSSFHLEALAFIPQLVLSALLIPFYLAEKDLPSCMLAQTFVFVTFNKVCTSQYFLWYLVFLPFYLPISSLISQPRKGLVALTLWVLGQVVWLQQGYQLEFVGNSTFTPGLFFSSLIFFAVNIWIAGIIISDVHRIAPSASMSGEKKAE